VRDWLKELRAQNLAIRKYEHTPLTRIHQWSEVPGGQSLFKTLFSFQDPSWDFALRAKGGKWAERRLDIRNQPNHPLWVDVYGGEELILKIGYDQNRFDDAVIARMLGHFQTVLKSMADDMAQHVGELPLLTEAERHQLFVEWNNTRADVPRGRCVHELFEAQVEIAPHAIALVHQKEAVSYWELDYQANRVANHLRSHGVGPDVPVGVCVERSIGMVVALLGILKAGGAYVPLDPAYPRERLAFMLEDSRAPALLTQSSLACDFKFETPKLKVICLESLLRGTATQPECKPRANVSPENLAYIIYTSGSTGTPKGVEITHRNLANLMTWHQWTYRVTPQDRATQLAGFSFDASVWELWPYLAAGARVCIVDNETRASASKLIHWLAEKKITLSFVPTPLAEEILQQPLRGDLALRAMLTGGDKLNRRPGTDLPFNLVNHYGPTENTVVTTFTVVAPTEGGDGAAPPIGKPISNVQVYVLDQRLRPVPIHVPGELYIGGESLARGYRNQPALTAEKFVRDPFSQDAGARLYKTGDLVRWLPDGNLEFLGRMDHQVKIRGYRIEPGEIEALLNRHPAVRESVIIATEAARGQKQLIAYLIAKGESKPGTKELADFLRTKLPDYMVPSAFVFLSAWPLTPNGKVDRNALPAPDQSSFKSSRAFVAPRNRFEGAAAKVWSEILGRTRIGIHDNFFELGGHSLLAAQAIARLNEEFKVALPVRSLFDEPTIAGLTREIEKSLDHGATRRAPALARVARDAYRVSECSPEMNAEPARKN
jgi:amino acid adenylation domain-containing protein